MVHMGGVGDFILTCPALAALSEDGPVELVGDKGRLEIAVAAGLAERVHSFASLEFDSIFSEPTDALEAFLASFDRAIVWMKDDGSLAEALNALGIGDVRVYPGLPPQQWDRHASEYYAEALSIELTSRPPFRLSVPKSIAAYDVVIHPGSGSPKKNWPLANFEELVSSLAREGREVRWCGGPAEMESESPLKTEHAASQLTNAALTDVASQLANTAVYIGNDSGITHLAAAVGCPTVAIFGPTNPRVWAPRGGLVEVVRAGNGDPWPSVEPVAQAARRALGARENGSR
jgi:hypothetical protein